MDPKSTVWRNVAALMRHQWGGENLQRLAREAKTSPGNCARLKAQKTSIGIDMLAVFAKPFGLQPWQLLVPSLDPANPPVVWMTQAERDLYDRMRQAAKDLASI